MDAEHFLLVVKHYEVVVEATKEKTAM